MDIHKYINNSVKDNNTKNLFKLGLTDSIKNKKPNRKTTNNIITQIILLPKS